MMRIKPFLLYLLLLSSCTTIDLYEKNTVIPNHRWESSFKPSFSFEIKDTTSAYQLSFIVRHTEKYNFPNIFINLVAQLPGQDTSFTIRQDLTLASTEKGWLGTGMDDIYEHRIKLGEPQTLRAGTYTFTIEQLMREDPLEHVMNAGLRLEKTK
jgi:gliding motility-associated lipoprotein GldH